MCLDALPFTFLLVLVFCISVDYAQAAPSSPDLQQRNPPSSTTRSLHIPIIRREVGQRNETELGIWAKQQKQFLEVKYGQPPWGSNSKCSTGYNLCVLVSSFASPWKCVTQTPTRIIDQNLDSRYVYLTMLTMTAHCILIVTICAATTAQ
jgi:hypothetical protein